MRYSLIWGQIHSTFDAAGNSKSCGPRQQLAATVCPFIGGSSLLARQLLLLIFQVVAHGKVCGVFLWRICDQVGLVINLRTRFRLEERASDLL